MENHKLLITVSSGVVFLLLCHKKGYLKFIYQLLQHLKAKKSELPQKNENNKILSESQSNSQDCSNLLNKIDVSCKNILEKIESQQNFESNNKFELQNKVLELEKINVLFKDLKQENDNLIKKLETRNHTFEDLEDNLNAWESEKSKLCKKIEKLKDDLSKIKQDNERLMNENEKLVNENNKLVREKEKMLKDFDKERAKFQKEIKKLEEKVNDHEYQRNQLLKEKPKKGFIEEYEIMHIKVMKEKEQKNAEFEKRYINKIKSLSDNNESSNKVLQKKIDENLTN